ncbi:MAG: sugar transferase [Acidobacteria bacterium]|nr:sugar transferase [Acidobacteriota bacterium]
MIRLFRVFFPTSVLALLLSEIVIIFTCMLIGTYTVIELDPTIFLLYDGGLSRMSLVVVSVLAGLYFQDLYTDLRVRSKLLLFQQLCLVIGVVFFLQALLTYLDPELMMPRWLMIVGCGLILVLLPFWRFFYSSFVLSALGAQRVLFLGANNTAREIAARVAERPELGMLTIGFLDETAGSGETAGGMKMLGCIGDLRELVERQQPDRIVVGLTERRQKLPMYDLLELRFHGIRIEEAATLYETAFGRVPIRDLRPSQLIFSTELGPQLSSVRMQTIYSTALALIGLIVFSPVMLLVAAAIKLTSKGPVLFRQQRVGRNGRQFTLLKFRSMVADAEAKTGAVWATKGDPRVTRLGKHLRRLRLDELPQLFNVLRGDMAIAGPRPERPEFVRTLSEKVPFYRQRHCVKPGITGWAQINYKYGETLEDTMVKLEYDLYYIKNLSLSLDMYIIFQTAKVMLFSEKGY